MARTKEMVVIDTKIPDPDSHFRLRGCKCGWEKAEYILLSGEGREEWSVECPKCGAHTPRSPIRHDTQIYWNTNMAAPPIMRRAI